MARGDYNRSNTERFIEKAKQIWGDTYDYSHVRYVGAHKKVTIKCQKHGFFDMRPTNHLEKACPHGCPKCSGYGFTPEEKFWENVNTEGPKIEYMQDCCWTWMGSRNAGGYGEFDAGERYVAHIFSYELHYGPIPETDNYLGRLLCLHRCDNPSCVRPDHLFLGDFIDNARDMVAKGRDRGPRGERHHKARLTWDIVRRIRELYSTGTRKSELARMFGVNRSHIWGIVERKIWKE